MPIVFGGALISFLVLFGVLGLIALHRASLPLVRGLFGGWAEQRGFRRWFLRAIGLDALANAIAWVGHRVRQTVANAAAANLAAGAVTRARHYARHSGRAPPRRVAGTRGLRRPASAARADREGARTRCPRGRRLQSPGPRGALAVLPQREQGWSRRLWTES